MVVLQEKKLSGYLVCPSMEVLVYAKIWISLDQRVSFVFLVYGHLVMNTNLFLNVVYTGIQGVISRRLGCCDKNSGPMQ